jgi:hypothetical protein
MAKAIKVLNSNDDVIAIVDNTTKALKAVEKDSCCSLADGTKLQSVNTDVKNGFAFVRNCQGGIYQLEIIEGSASYIRREKQYLNCELTSALFN